jgi:hypothetical protein
MTAFDASLILQVLPKLVTFQRADSFTNVLEGLRLKHQNVYSVKLVGGKNPDGSGISLKVFGFIAESMFTIIPESCLGSPRNAVRIHPGIAFHLGPDSSTAIAASRNFGTSRQTRRRRPKNVRGPLELTCSRHSEARNGGRRPRRGLNRLISANFDRAARCVTGQHAQPFCTMETAIAICADAG